MKKNAITQPKKTIPISIRVSKEDLAMMRKKAKKYASGNVSAFIRYAALKYVEV